MGTLFNQPVREIRPVSLSDLKETHSIIKQFAKDTGVTIDQAIKIFEIEEYNKRTAVMILDGNVHDEQMAGMGQLLKSFIDKVDFIAKQLEEIKQQI